MEVTYKIILQIVDLSGGEETEENEVLIIPDSEVEKSFETDEKNKNVKNGGINEEFESHDDISIYSSFMDDGEIKYIFSLSKMDFCK